MLTILAFGFALAVLVTVHEYGHYRAARAAGVRVLRFSIGFGKPLLRWRWGPDATEFVLAAVPLGGYVRMLDEREAPVAPQELARAFNRQSAWKRAGIVAAGPLANLALAVLLFALLAWIGTRQPVALLGPPPAGSPAAAAGLQGGEQVLALSIDGGTQTVRAWPGLELLLQTAAVQGQRVRLDLRRADGGTSDALLDFSKASAAAAEADFLSRWGLHLQGPPARVVDVLPGQAAARAGVQAGDVVVAVDGTAVREVQDLLRAVQHADGRTLDVRLRRGDALLQARVTPQRQEQSGAAPVWRIGVMLDQHTPTVLVRYGLLGGLREGLRRTWDLSTISLRTLGLMVVGKASLGQLSGPVTIADYAGRSASLGWLPYLNFLAVVSLSLGVLNLLPIPVLDGGHLLYYLVEILTRRSIPQRVQDRLQQGGLAVIALLLAVALYNDFARLLGPFH